MIYKYGLPKFVRYARNIWHVDDPTLSDEQTALEGIRRLEAFIAEIGIPKTLREVGATEEMLPLIAESTIKGGGYHKVTTEEVLQVLKECF